MSDNEEEIINIGALPIDLPTAAVNVTHKKDAAAHANVPDDEPEYQLMAADTNALHSCEDFDEPAPINMHRRRELIRMISSYKNMFAPHLVEIESSLQDLASLSMDQLEALLMDVTYMVQTRQSVKMIRATFINSTVLVEGVGAMAGLKLAGLSTLCASSEVLLECVDEIAISRAPQVQDPVHRLALEMIKLCYTLDQHNRARENAAAASPLAEGL